MNKLYTEKDKFRITHHKNMDGWDMFILQMWNPIYMRWTTLKTALKEIQFIYDYCLLNDIPNSKSFPIVKV